MKPKLLIVGAGPGDPLLLTGAAREAVLSVERVLAAPRIAAALAPLRGDIPALDLPGLRAELDKEPRRDTAVLVSGDAGFYSLSKTLYGEYADRYELETVNGVSSLQYFCGRLGVPWDDARVLSLHGRAGCVVGPAAYNAKLFVLTGGEADVGTLISALAGAGMERLQVSVGERLSSPEERILTGSPAELAGLAFVAPAVLLIENPSPADPGRRLRDEDFLRGEVPMTKEEVRLVAAARLQVAPGHTVWDVGAGTGAMSVALACAARDGAVHAVERSAAALRLLRLNRERLGAYNMEITEGEAPEALERLPPPDRLFIGGSGGRLRGIIECALRKSGRLRLCAAAVTLETVQEALACLREYGFIDIEVASLQVTRAKRAGNSHMLSALNPVTLLSGERAP